MQILEGYVSRPQLADELGVCTRTINRWQQEGLPYIRVGTRPFFAKADVLEFLKRRAEGETLVPPPPRRRYVASPKRKGG